MTTYKLWLTRLLLFWILIWLQQYLFSTIYTVKVQPTSSNYFTHVQGLLLASNDRITSSLRLGRDVIVNPPSCSSNQHLVFIKIHKSGSSTVALILQRYGIAHNKTFALPAMKRYTNIFHLNWLFTKNMTLHYQEESGEEGFDLLVNHARMNRPEMDMVVKNAFYLTILRHPVTQFESAFGYFNLGPHFRRFMKNESNPVTVFFSNSKFHFDRLAYLHHFRNYIWNGQLFDLGTDPEMFGNIDYIASELARLQRELDLVLIMEYFDESLIILKKLLCLEYKDILYIQSNVRKENKRIPLNSQLEQQIASWNSADMLLYETFNRTLWHEVEEYGPTFVTDLELFRSLNRKVRVECEATDYSFTFPSVSCMDLFENEYPLNKKIRKLMKYRFNLTAEIPGVPYYIKPKPKP